MDFAVDTSNNTDFLDIASGISLTEYEGTTARKTGVGPYTVHYDGWGSMAVQTMATRALGRCLSAMPSAQLRRAKPFPTSALGHSREVKGS